MKFIWPLTVTKRKTMSRWARCMLMRISLGCRGWGGQAAAAWVNAVLLSSKTLQAPPCLGLYPAWCPFSWFCSFKMHVLWEIPLSKWKQLESKEYVHMQFLYHVRWREVSVFQCKALKSGGKMHSLISLSDIALAVLLWLQCRKCCCSYFKYLGQLSLGF